jgi:3-hydroxybutyryl-CoA dehydrogenase
VETHVPIGVIGAGTMGSGIAQVFASTGFHVLMYDIADAAISRGIAAIENSLSKLVQKQKIDAAQNDATKNRIRGVTTLSSLSNCQLVLEAATENVAIKLDLFRELDNICAPDTILATNTSSISITRIATETKRPQQVIGMHFFNPVPVMQLVEVIRARQTSDEVHARVVELCKALGKTSIDVKNRPAFVVNRLALPMINEAVFALSEGLASAEDIDTAMKLGMGHPMGPLALADLIGLDTCLSIMEVLYQGFGDSKYRPCPLLREMVEAGYLGRKTGQGFHSYSR